MLFVFNIFYYLPGSPKNVSPNPHTLISELKKRIKKERDDDDKK